MTDATVRHLSSQRIRDLVALTKPGIVLWLLITAYAAMVVARQGIPAWSVTLWTLIGLGMSAGGAHAVNMWYDRDIDPLMRRTAGRPVAAGRLAPRDALWFGIVLGVGSFVLMGYTVNWLAAGSSLAGYLFYIFVYTMWLKRRTPQNIVIGGAAGAFPPIVGWAAVTGHLGLVPGLMFLIIFLWTPPHFWALALYRQEDYRQAGIPMMPVVKGERYTKIQSLVYSILALVVSVSLYWTHTEGPLYLWVALLLGLGFIAYNVRLLMEHGDVTVWARRTFRYSLIYVAVLFVAMTVGIHG